MIVIDNVVRDGAVADVNSDDPRVRGVRAVVDVIAKSPELDATALQTVGEKGWDGLIVVRSMPIGGSLSIRARDERDVRKIVGWVPDAAALYLFSGPRMTWPLTVQQMQDMVAIRGSTPYAVVTVSDDLVGHFDLTIDGTIARLGRVIVSPALRGQGLPADVVDLAFAQARRLGADAVHLNVIAANVPALRTYWRAGFATTEGDTDRADVIAMERRLSLPCPCPQHDLRFSVSEFIKMACECAEHPTCSLRVAAPKALHCDSVE
ncbi:GNAT family N-acetyltransferase [Microbacterium betulae]|uniref:GNAT family N-acetyltransferase n=1 Tax=Microbacterium betulae TaxID=2981139 RepID=A0AA97I595_9MICO|nr:GNAT family N-acetyltransferase [Microbacterium sp. AB]WOF22574.1 GNAT family N-acetyltransferase [Microbacterium sp. AB]